MSALGGVIAALKTLCAADAGVAALLANSPGAWAGVNGKAVYDDGAAPQPTQALPMSTLTPWITVGAGTEIPQGTLVRRGWDCTVQIKVTAQGPESVGLAVVAALSALLFPDGTRRTLTVAGFPTCAVMEFTVQPTLVSTVGGLVTREVPVIVRVYAI